MTTREQLIKKLYTGESTKAELHQLLDLVRDDPTIQHSAILEKLWEQLNDADELEEPLSAALIEASLQRTHGAGQLKSANHSRHTLKNSKPLFLRRRTWMSAAAAVLLLISGYWGWNLWETSQMVNIQTAFGEQQTIELPDNSTVKLNANSSIRFKKYWGDTAIREVWLEGEAYFEVNKNEQTGQKFHVITDDLQVEVLGTVFNVNSRRQSTKVFLEEGSVSINLPEQAEDQKILMVPGELVTYTEQNQKLEKKTVQEEAPASWKDGAAMMQDMPLQDIILKVQDIYGIQVIVEDQAALSRSFSVGIPVNNVKTAHLLLRELTKLNIIDNGDHWVIK